MLCAWGMAILGYIDGYMWGAGGEEEKKRYTSTSTTGINTRVIKLMGGVATSPAARGDSEAPPASPPLGGARVGAAREDEAREDEARKVRQWGARRRRAR